ncbi:RNA recognition motif domain-containing protein [Candidatus Nitrospira bockiana]
MLRVGNLPATVTPEDLRHLFERYGLVVTAEIARDEKGHSLGYGFVQMALPQSAKNAIQKLDGACCFGPPLSVKSTAWCRGTLL